MRILPIPSLSAILISPRSGMTLQMFQQLTGANYFFYYGATIFTSVGIQDSFVTQIILGAVNFVCTFGGIYVMERVSHITDFSVLVY